MAARAKKLVRQHSEPTRNITKIVSKEKVAETVESASLDGKRINVTFLVVNQNDDSFKRSFKFSYTVLELKRKLSRILKIPIENLAITKNDIPISNDVHISQLGRDDFQNIELEVFATNGSFIDIDVGKETFDETISVSFKDDIPKKIVHTNVICKFQVTNQNHSFTKAFSGSCTVGRVKEDISEVLNIDKSILLLVKSKMIIDDGAFLSDLEMDNFGNLDIELFTKDGTKLKFDTVYKDVHTADVLSVTVQVGSNSFVNINVEVIDARINKPYLGGYRNKETGLEYHHAFSQTDQRKQKLPPEMKNHRETQTILTNDSSVDTLRTRGTQMSCSAVFVPNVTDVVLRARPYREFVSHSKEEREHAARIIHRAWKVHCFRKAVSLWLHRCNRLIQNLKSKELEEVNAQQARLQRGVVSTGFPRSREDFDQLYAMVDRWRNTEIARISKLHTKGPKVAEFCLLLDKEIQLLRSIEKFQIELKDDYKKQKEKNLLEEMSKLIVWKNAKGETITMDTLEAQQGRQLKELYLKFCRTDLKLEERMELLVNFKYTLKQFKTPLTDQLVNLLERECDLIVRNVPNKELDGLRKRIQSLLFQFIKSPEFNAGGTRRIDIKAQANMKNERLYHCKQCGNVKLYTDFPLHSRTREINKCMSCTWISFGDQTSIDMTNYKVMLRAIRREERRRGRMTCLAFVMQEKDIYYIVEKIWHSHSVLSEVNDLTDLSLCQWKVDEEWSPWNCILLTNKEMKAHLMLSRPELVYDPDLVKKVASHHMLGRAHFKHLAGTGAQKTEDNNIKTVRVIEEECSEGDSLRTDNF